MNKMCTYLHGNNALALREAHKLLKMFMTQKNQICLITIKTVKMSSVPTFCVLGWAPDTCRGQIIGKQGCWLADKASKIWIQRTLRDMDTQNTLHGRELILRFEMHEWGPISLPISSLRQHHRGGRQYQVVRTIWANLRHQQSVVVHLSSYHRHRTRDSHEFCKELPGSPLRKKDADSSADFTVVVVILALTRAF